MVAERFQVAPSSGNGKKSEPNCANWRKKVRCFHCCHRHPLQCTPSKRHLVRSFFIPRPLPNAPYWSGGKNSCSESYSHLRLIIHFCCFRLIYFIQSSRINIGVWKAKQSVHFWSCGFNCLNFNSYIITNNAI